MVEIGVLAIATVIQDTGIDQQLSEKILDGIVRERVEFGVYLLQRDLAEHVWIHNLIQASGSFVTDFYELGWAEYRIALYCERVGRSRVAWHPLKNRKDKQLCFLKTC